MRSAGFDPMGAPTGAGAYPGVSPTDDEEAGAYMRLVAARALDTCFPDPRWDSKWVSSSCALQSTQ